MKHLLTLTIILSIFITACAQNTSENTDSSIENESEITTFYFIRHSEKDRSDANNSNPNLTEKGKARAERWSEELSDVEFDVIYSTDYNRTKQTATPLANYNQLEIKTYDPSIMKDPSFAENHQGQTVMIVGHSNTTPMFANAILGKDKYPEMDDLNNANLYVVTIKNGIATSEMRKVD